MLDMSPEKIKELTKSTDKSGEGSFSAVWISPENKAIKVCPHANADAWLWYALFCIAVKKAKTIELVGDEVPLECLLNVHGIRLDIEKNEYVASMEVLKEPGKAYNSWESDPDLDTIYRPSRELVDILFELSESFLTHDVEDRHNYMKDEGGRVVLSDPVCYTGWRSLKAKEEWRGNLYLFSKAVEKFELQDYIEIV